MPPHLQQSSPAAEKLCPPGFVFFKRVIFGRSNLFGIGRGLLLLLTDSLSGSAIINQFLD